MGWLINNLRKYAELFSKNNSIALRLSGFLITLTLIIISGYCGWLIERLLFTDNKIIKSIGLIILIFSLASAIAYKSLAQNVIEILKLLKDNNLKSAQKKLAHIVGRDTNNLDKQEILRAAAESTSENSVDGIFAPIFWMLIGLLIWDFSTDLPGPLAISWIFKATSTIDSMLGYKQGNLYWLGYAGAKLDDLLTWIPCRIVLITLPLITIEWKSIPEVIKSAWLEGSIDESPNSGLSEAIFAHCFQIRMGGDNKYNDRLIRKELLAPNAPKANEKSIMLMIRSILFLECFWIGFFSLIYLLIKG